MPTPIREYVGAAWLANGERGLSSNAMYARFTGKAARGAHGDHPYDPADFRRCELLLREVPMFRDYLPMMADVSPEWAALVDHWGELVALAESEVPDVFTRSCRDGRAPLTYARMKELFAEARAKGDS